MNAAALTTCPQEEAIPQQPCSSPSSGQSFPSNHQVQWETDLFPFLGSTSTYSLDCESPRGQVALAPHLLAGRTSLGLYLTCSDPRTTRLASLPVAGPFRLLYDRGGAASRHAQAVAPVKIACKRPETSQRGRPTASDLQRLGDRRSPASSSTADLRVEPGEAVRPLLVRSRSILQHFSQVRCFAPECPVQKVGRSSRVGPVLDTIDAGTVCLGSLSCVN